MLNNYRHRLNGIQGQLTQENTPANKAHLEADKRYYSEQIIGMYLKLLRHEKPKLQSIEFKDDPNNPLHMQVDLKVLSDADLQALSRILRLAAQRDRNPIVVNPVKVHVEMPRRTEQRERAGGRRGPRPAPAHRRSRWRRRNNYRLMAVYEADGAAVDVLVVDGMSFCDGRGISQKHASGLMTRRLRAALLPKQDIDIFAPGNLGVRRDEMVAQLALAHDRACLIESLS
jgi:hypothetical protein